MKNILFLVSHIGADSNFLFDTLSQNPRIQGHRTSQIYHNYLSVEHLTLHPHKNDNSAAVWMDEILFNFSLSKDLCKLCSFVYLVREAKPSLNKIISKGYLQRGAMYYYMYRLRRICELAKRTPGAVLLTWEDMISGKGFFILEKYLNLKKSLQSNYYDLEYKNVVDIDCVEKAQKSYERHLWFLKNLDLQKV